MKEFDLFLEVCRLNFSRLGSHMHPIYLKRAQMEIFKSSQFHLLFSCDGRTVTTLSTIPMWAGIIFHCFRSYNFSFHLVISITFKSFSTSSSHLYRGLPLSLYSSGFFFLNFLGSFSRPSHLLLTSTGILGSAYCVLSIFYTSFKFFGPYIFLYIFHLNISSILL